MCTGHFWGWKSRGRCWEQEHFFFLQVEEWDVEKRSFSLDGSLFMGTLLSICGLWLLESWAGVQTSCSRAGELSPAFSTHTGIVSQLPDTAEMGMRGLGLLRTFLFKNHISSTWKFKGKNRQCLISSQIETTIFCGYIYHIKDNLNSLKFKLHT